MITPIHALIFDFGNVLINWDPRQIFQKFFDHDPRVVERFMDEIDFHDWNLQQDKGYPFKQAVADHCARFPQYAHIIHAYDEQWEESITGLIPGTVELLPRLKAAGYPLYGLTNWSIEKFNVVRNRYAFFGLFDEILVSGQVKLIKPDPAIYHLLLQHIQRPPQECFFIDDSPANIAAAEKIGFQTYHFTSPEALEKHLRELGILP